MKRILSMIIVALFVMTFMVVLLPSTASAATYRTVKFKLTSTSSVSWAKLYVNGSYKGHVRKSGYKRIRLRAGKEYKIVAKRSFGGSLHYRKKMFYVSKNSSTSVLCFLHTSAKSGSSNSSSGSYSSGSSSYRTVKFKLTSTSSVSWAKLYINGSYKGHVRKSSYKRIRLRTRKTYRIVAKKTMGGSYFERKKSLYVSSSSSSKLCFLHVSKKSGASFYSGSGAVSTGSSKYKTIKFKLTGSSSVSWAKLYINGSYKGHVRKTSYKRIRLRTGKEYRIVAKRTYDGEFHQRKKNLFVGSGSSSKLCFLHISAKAETVSRYRKVKCKLTSSSKVAWAKLYVNGSYKGRVTRSSYKVITLRTGKEYDMKIKRTYRGKRYSRIKSVRVNAGNSAKIVFFHPIAR